MRPSTVDEQIVEKPPKRALRWAEQYVRREMWVSGLGSIVLAIVGVIALIITFWGWYAVLAILTSGIVPLSHTGLLIGAGVAVALVFVAHWTTDREELERLEFESTPGTRMAVFVASAAGYSPLGLLSSRRNAHAYVKVLSILFLIAPQALTASLHLDRRLFRLRKMDVDGCARALTVLIQADGKVTFDELAQRAPGVDWLDLLPMLRDMVGVVFLFTPPAGLTIANHLREEITGRK